MSDQDVLQYTLLNAVVVIGGSSLFLLYYLRRGLGPRRTRSKGRGLLILCITAALALAAGTLVAISLTR